MDIVEFESECPDKSDGCNGTVNGSVYMDEYGELVKFIYQECDKCGWNQGS